MSNQNIKTEDILNLINAVSEATGGKINADTLWVNEDDFHKIKDRPEVRESVSIATFIRDETQ